jgi:hypothetical protein
MDDTSGDPGGFRRRFASKDFQTTELALCFASNFLLAAITLLERGGFRSNRHRALGLWWSRIFSERAGIHPGSPRRAFSGPCSRTLQEGGMTNSPGQRILVVEDSWHLGVALKSLLRSVGAEVVGPVATAAEAERLIAEQVPDVAIVDFNLRGGELAYDLIDKFPATLPCHCLPRKWRRFCKSRWSKSNCWPLCRSGRKADRASPRAAANGAA